MLSNEWVVKEFYPIDFIPKGVRLTAYSGEASDLPPDVLQAFLNDVAGGLASVPFHASFPLSAIPEAHARMENNAGVGKLVALPWAEPDDDGDVVEFRHS